ncbi:nucleotide-binding universal stress UspA family protein [Microbacterium phyllosphaerae]|uniref:Nucleotide-binding universal stress UspA family protein n=1 Tax=Microbacterium phyllosphaerae TaxID=124798 RepID=A0ABS4WRB2_9MICO|nr:universal stress protein [Microbacterium phyllosphaerae]MBP2378730.1 nucleotide-binding universal stress UspA family protein [Microbacterium phyllosphaerae]
MPDLICEGDARMPARYVLGVGDSDAAAAGRWAESHARRDGIPLVRVHVGGGVTEQTPAHKVGTQEMDIVHIGGRVPEALARFVTADDVLVIGTGKTGFIHSRVFGSVSLQIAAEARCSVAVIPMIDLRFRRGIVAGVKDDDLMTAIIRAAAGEASARQEPIELIHSFFSGVIPAMVETRATIAARVAALESLVDAGTRVRTRYTQRPPAEALLDASRNAALLVVGAGHPSGAGHALGAVTHDVLVNIDAPVLVVRRTAADRTSPESAQNS